MPSTPARSQSPGPLTGASVYEFDTPTSAAFPRGLGLVNCGAPILGYGSPPPPEPQLPTVSTIRRPFQLMRRIQATTINGGYLSSRLYVPRSMWFQTGVKLSAVETKIRMIDLLVGGLENLERMSELVTTSATSTALQLAGNRFARELELFDGMLDDIQNTLSKKLGFVESSKGKRNGQSSLGAWSSKLSRSFDRMTNAKSVDSPVLYVENLQRVFTHAQILDHHLSMISGDVVPSPYPNLDSDLRLQIEQRLRRSSDFFASVICRFVMRDISLLIDKHVKRAGLWCIE